MANGVSNVNGQALRREGTGADRTSDGESGTGFRDALLAALPALRRFAARWTHADTDRDDLVQATCERALSHHSSWQPGTRMDSWLFKIAQNLAIDQARTTQRRETLLQINSTPADINVNSQPDAESRLAVRDVNAALAALPMEQRAVVEAVCIDGLSYNAAAEKLAIPRGTVMSRLYRGRSRLHAALGLGQPNGLDQRNESGKAQEENR